MRALLAVATMLALATPGAADHCTTWTTSSPEADTAAPGFAEPRFYVDRDFSYWCLGPFGLFCDIWVYEESNGIAGLQRGDESVDDTCHGMIRADTVIF